MEFRNVNTSNLTFKYPVTWEKEKADTYNNPDCVATLSKGEENLLNVVMFPTRTNIEDYKLFMEDAISDDGGVILESDFVEIAGKHAIKTNGNIYIFELRTVEASLEPVTEFKDMINTLVLK